MTDFAPEASPVDAVERRMPPIAEIAVAAMALIVVAGIYLVSYLPQQAALGPAVALVTIAGVLVVVNIVLLSRLRDFAWEVFFRVAGWTLLAYGVISGMLLFVFLKDATKGSLLVLLTLSLVLFAIDIPILLAFSVARYQKPS
jgi:hypothetical protein